MRCPLVVAVLILASRCASAAVAVGGPAPAIALDQLMPAQPVANATLSALAGKAIVLEFWATWCAPCIDQIPHINQLEEQFQDRPIQFISITDEEPSLIEGFLKKRPIRGWVGIERKRQTYKAYGFDGIPQTVLIDPSGKVAAMAYPAHITAAHLEDLLAGRPVTVPQPKSEPPISRTGEEGGPAPILDVLIRPASGNDSSSSSSAGKYSARAATLRSLLARAYSFLPDRIEGEPVSSAQRYDVNLSLPGVRIDGLDVFLREVVCNAFHVKVSRETRDIDVLVLKAPTGKPAGLTETVSTGGSMTSTGKGQVKVIGSPLSSFANVVAGVIHKNVIDETGLPGKYDIVLPYDKNEPDRLLDAIRDKLGLAVERARRPVEFLVVSSAAASPKPAAAH